MSQEVAATNPRADDPPTDLEGEYQDSGQATQSASASTQAPPDGSRPPPAVAFNFEVTEVFDAEAEAASAGKPIRWKANGQKGYAVPSDVTIAAETGVQCRNVYATVDDLDQRSPVIRMCQSPTGAWARAN